MTVVASILFLAALQAALPQPEHPFLRNFATTGTVTAAAENGNFILETAGRPVYIFNRLPTALRPGEVIAARGLTNDDIARQLGITKIGVKKHLTKIFAKLNVANRAEAASLALRKHLLKT